MAALARWDSWKWIKSRVFMYKSYTMTGKHQRLRLQLREARTSEGGWGRAELKMKTPEPGRQRANLDAFKTRPLTHTSPRKPPQRWSCYYSVTNSTRPSCHHDIADPPSFWSWNNRLAASVAKEMWLRLLFGSLRGHAVVLRPAWRPLGIWSPTTRCDWSWCRCCSRPPANAKKMMHLF